jgi:RHS repeat-associated protein
MVNDMDIIHMNGRTYNVALGRFMQADPHIQAPTHLQNYNRYSYVLNNPMSYTDPSGYFFKKLGKFMKKYWRTITAIVVSVYMPGMAAFANWSAAATGAVTGFVAGGIATGSLKGALVGAFTGAMFGGIHDGFAGKAISAGMKVGKTLLHGIAGGIGSVLNGGKFGHGFVAAGFTQSISQGGDVFVDGDRLGNAIKAAAIGGTASAITGGKFGNGAVTGAFSRLLNDDAVSKALPADTPDSDRNTIASEIYNDAEFRAKQLLKWQADESWDAVRSEYSFLSSVSDNQMSSYIDNYVQEFRVRMLKNVSSVTVKPLVIGAEKALTVGTSILFDRRPRSILESIVGVLLPSPPPVMRHEFIYTRSKIDVGFVRR